MEHGIVSFTCHRQLLQLGEDLVSPGRLRFRTENELASSLAAARFTLLQTFGDWDRRPRDSTYNELIMVARADEP